MAVDTEYEEDARRIEREYINPTSTSQDDVEEDLRNENFAEGAIDDIKDWILSEEDVGGPALDPHSDGVTTREEIHEAVENADGVGYSSSHRDSVTSAIARDVGAPTESELQQAQLSALSESVTPGEMIEGDDRSTPSSVVRDTEGDPVGIVGPQSGQEIAEEMGVEYLGSSPSDFADDLSVQAAPDGSRGLLYYNGRAAIAEVDLE